MYLGISIFKSHLLHLSLMYIVSVKMFFFVGGNKAYTLRWEGRPETPRFAIEEDEEIELIEEIAVSKPKQDLAWLKKMEYRRFGIDKLIMSDMKKMNEKEVDAYARSFKSGGSGMGIMALKAVRDYAAAKQDHISIKKGDIVNVLENSDPTWWKGEINGKVGLFPAACLELEQVIAIRDFTGTKPDELNFQKGEIITLLDRSDHNWWRGQILPRTGRFPRTFVTLLPRQPNGDIDSGTKFIALRDSNPNSPDELQFSKGDIINVLDFSRNDKWKGALNGATGYFPPDAVCLLQNAGIGAAKAIRDHPGSKQGELPFKKGDRVVILEKVTEGLWKGMVNNQVGLFPASYVEPEQCVAQTPFEGRRHDDLVFPKFAVISVLDKSDPERWKGEYNGKIGFFPPGVLSLAEQYPALRDYKATRGEELSLRKGDVITILERNDADFYLVNVHGSIGYVPKYILSAMETRPPEACTEVMAVKDYNAKKPDELSFPKFATIQLLEQPPGDMWKGRYNGKVGYFPRSLVEPMLGQKVVENALNANDRGKKLYGKDDVLEAEFSAMKAFFLERAGFYKNMFSYYATMNTVGYSDVNSMSNAQFMSFVKECKMLSTQFRPADVDIIFVASNVQNPTDRAPGAKKDSDHAMVIQEFLAGIIRLAHSRYKHLPKLIDRVRAQYEQDVKPNAMPLMHDLVKKFKPIYNPVTKVTTEKFQSQIQSLFSRIILEERISNNRLPFEKIVILCRQYDLFGTDKLSIFLLRMIFMYSTSASEDSLDVDLETCYGDLDFDQFIILLTCIAKHFHTLLPNPESVGFPQYLETFFARIV
eukprot:TRINITY_DN1636_c0_g1_i9.p1 TRINITY_DN1636_c0_g1~~TRINITY_DN1636_c0_g1_i9.p1  ORF type:complete len:818 (+),score=140.52 TRINITY_DN1636_c0_g1_i9:474-2927(+)